VSDQTIYNWRTQGRIDRGLQPGVTTQESVELGRARRRIRELETELTVVRQANELLRIAPTQRRWEVASQVVSEGLPVEIGCRELGISVSGFYARRNRRPPARAVRHAMIPEVIRAVHDRSRQNLR
jgi:hypothetical protein